MTSDAAPAQMPETQLDACAAKCCQQSTDEQTYWACIETCDGQQEERVMKGCSVVPTDVLERIGLALWGLMEDEGWTDDLLGLEPGDRLQIPGALTGRIDRALSAGDGAQSGGAGEGAAG